MILAFFSHEPIYMPNTEPRIPCYINKTRLIFYFKFVQALKMFTLIIKNETLNLIRN